MASMMIICIASFSIEIAKLKTQTNTVSDQCTRFCQQVLSVMHQLLQQIQRNITDAIEAERAENSKHLNTSIDALHSSLDNQINQLNMSINQLHQQIILAFRCLVAQSVGISWLWRLKSDATGSIPAGWVRGVTWVPIFLYSSILTSLRKETT